MPTYEYACRVCKNEFEADQSIKEQPLEECPKCLTNALYRLISSGSFILKGSTWAKDGYANKK